MSAQDKQVRITFAVDDSSLAKAKRAISELTQQVEKLVEATNKINLGGGGGGGARVGSFSNQPGSSVGSQLQTRVTQSTGGLTDGLARAVQGTSQVFKAASTESTSAFNKMKSDLRDFSRVTEQEINRIVGAIGKLSLARGGIGMGSGGGQGLGALRSAGEAESYAMRGQSFYGRMEQNASSMGPNAADTLRRQLFGAPSPGVVQGGGGGIPGISQMGKMLGMAGNATGMGFLAAASPWAVAAGAGAYLYSANKEYGLASNEAAIGRPMMNITTQAGISQALAGQGYAVRRGDMGLSGAMLASANDKDFKAITSKERGDALMKQYTEKWSDINNLPAAIKDRVGRGERRVGNALKGSTGSGYGTMMATGWTGAGAAAIEPQKLGSFYGDDGTGRLEWAREQAANELKLKQASDQQEYIQKKQASMSPRLIGAMNEIYNNASGFSGLADASRTSGAIRFDKKGNPISNATMDAEARALGHGWTLEQIAGSMAGSVGALGWKGSGQYGERLLGLGAGGFGSAANVIGAGGQYGSANGLLGAFQGKIGGRRGLDIGAGSTIGGFVAQQMMSGNFSGNGGEGFAQAMLDGSYRGGGMADLRGAREAQAGYGAWQAHSQGTMDGVGSAMSWSTAINAAGPNSTYGTRKALHDLDMASQMDIMRKGIEKGSILEAQGVTQEMVQQAHEGTRNALGMRGGPEMTSKENWEALQEFKRTGKIPAGKGANVAAALKDSGDAKTNDEAWGMLGLEDPMKAKGTGAHRSFSMKSPTGTAFKTAKQMKQDESEFVAKNHQTIEQAIAAGPSNAAYQEALSLQAQRAAGGTGDLNASIQSISAAMTQFVHNLQRALEGTSNRGHAPQGE